MEQKHSIGLRGPVPCDKCLDQFVSTRHQLHQQIKRWQSDYMQVKGENERLRARNAELVEQEIRLRLDRQDAAPQPQPLAWMYTAIRGDGTTHGPHLILKPEYMDAMSASKGAKAVPLYTAPPQPQQVTDPIGRPQSWPNEHTITLGQKLRHAVEQQRQQAISAQEGAAS